MQSLLFPFATALNPPLPPPLQAGPSPLAWLLRLVVIVLLLFAMAVGLAHVVDLGEYGQYLLDFVGALSGAATWW